MIRPSRARFLIAEQPEPLALSLPRPEADAFELYRRIAVPGRPSFLLESGKGSESIARYSFIGSDPYLVISGKGRRYELRTRDQTVVKDGSPFGALAGLLRASRVPRPEGLPPFFGGAVGFLSYDAVRRFERLPRLAVDDLHVQDLEFVFVDLVTALDHQTGTLHLIFAPPLQRLLGEPREKLYREGCDRLAELEAKLSTPKKHFEDRLRTLELATTPWQSRADYVAKVQQCKGYIGAGDIYQANLSHRFTIELGTPSSSNPSPDPTPQGGEGKGIEFRCRSGQEGERTGLMEDDAQALYSRLRQVNPSPFSALLVFQDVSLVSSSPERLIRLQGSRADTRPIAGTRPRGKSVAADRRLVEELLRNEKERAEHLMLVDLERNDLGRVCRYGTVRANEFMLVERYSHVSHIVSNIQGELHERFDGFDLLRAMFPGGTITGVPKIRCMEILDHLEPVRRGLYTGSLGYLSWSGDLDLNIIIRTLVLIGGRGYLQVGAGIVADSDPSREYDETLYKAEAVMESIGKK